MASSRDKYFKNYQFEQVPDDSKKGYKNVYKYIGDYYTWDLPASSLKSQKLLFGALELATIVLFLFAALQDTVLNNSIYIILPAIISICAWIFEMIAVCFFCFMKFPLKEEDYKRIDSTFFLTFPIRLLCLGLVAVTCIWDIVRLSLGLTGVLAAAGYLACAAIALAFLLLYKKLSQKKKVILEK